MRTQIALGELDDYIGYIAGPTDWLTIDQPRIDAFADCTLDRQFIHVDPATARQTPFGSTIAHGFLTLSLLSHFAEQLPVTIAGIRMAVNYGLNKVRFINPVRVNSRVRALAKVLEITEKEPGQFQVVLEMTMEVEGEEKPALVAEWLVLQFS